MKTLLTQKIKDLRKIVHISPLLILSGLSFIIALLLTVYPYNIFQGKKYQVAHNVKGISYVKPTNTPTETPTPTIIYRQVVKVLPTVQPTITSQPTDSQQTTNHAQAALPIVAQITQTPTQAPAQTINMQIIDPDGASSFSVTLNPGNNLCDNLNEAKNEGKINSVTMTWYVNFNSYYVNQINGFSNNWTTTVNGTQPKVGCSLIKPNPNDKIVWRFG